MLSYYLSQVDFLAMDSNLSHFFIIFLSLIVLQISSLKTPLTNANLRGEVSVFRRGEKSILLDPGRMCGRGRKSKEAKNFILPGKGVNGRERRKVSSYCAKEPQVLNEATKGALLATQECQHQFRGRHWNCTSLPRSIRKVLTKTTRETAFVHAITSAGVTFSVTQGCSSGQIHDCPCDRSLSGSKSTEGNWEWGGCGDNVHVGYKRSKEILDSKIEKRTDVRSLIILHNNEAGRLAVRNHMRLVCKCHGLSGSCTLKTCWQKVPTFREVGERLKSRFDGASKVIPGNDGKSVIPAISSSKSTEEEDLLYSDPSPDFCASNNLTGSLGTRGRECNGNSMGVDGCELLCCGRGYRTKIVKIKQNCRCRFKWCCEVSCDTCVVTKVVHTCR